MTERYEMRGGELVRVVDVETDARLPVAQALAAIEIDESTGRATLVLYGGRGPTLRRELPDT